MIQNISDRVATDWMIARYNYNCTLSGEYFPLL